MVHKLQPDKVSAQVLAKALWQYVAGDGIVDRVPKDASWMGAKKKAGTEEEDESETGANKEVDLCALGCCAFRKLDDGRSVYQFTEVRD